MPAAAPVRAEVSYVGFSLKGRDYTPAQPCLFDDACTRADAVNWYKHSQHWLAALAARASTAEQRDAVTRLARQHEEVNQRDCMTNCGSAVSAFVSMAQLSKAMLDDWGADVTEVDNDWGWVFPLELPIPDWVLATIKKDMQQKALWKLIPLAVLAYLLFTSSKRRGWL